MVTKSEIKDPEKILATVPVSDDIVDYMMRCVLALAPDLSDAIRKSAEKQVYELFGGNRVWVSKTKGNGKFARNAQIRRDYRSGERVTFLERRYGLSQARIWQIINE
jgi:Mor family transcriptional regulator